MNVKSKVAAVALSGALLAALPGTALAATDYAEGFDEGADLLSKTWTAANSAQYKEQTFKFTMSLDSMEGIGGYAAEDVEEPAMPAGGVSVEVDAGEGTGGKKLAWNENTTAYASVNDLLGQVTFSTPGVYWFDLSENDVDNKDIKKDATTYKVKVIVVSKTDQNNAPIAGVEIKDVRVYTSDKKKINPSLATFANSAADNGNLTIEKVLKGNSADPDDVFQFEVVLDNVGEGKYAVSYSSEKDGNPAAVVAGSNMVYLHGNESLEIQNLPAGATYTVREVRNDYFVAGGYEMTSLIYHDNNKMISKNDEDKVTVTNTKNTEIDTGMVMDVAPYALAIGVVVVGGAAYVVSRRRRADQRF